MNSLTMVPLMNTYSNGRLCMISRYNKNHFKKRYLPLGLSCIETRIRNGFFSSLAKKLQNDDDVNESYDASFVSPHGELNKQNTSQLDLTQKISGVKVASSNNVSNKMTKVGGNMPRLNELRKRLAQLDQNAPSLLSTVTTSTTTKTRPQSVAASTPKKTNRNSNTSSPSEDKTNKISWREVLQSAQEQLSMHKNVDLLTDSFSRPHSYLRISLGERCNLRCLYCMPPEGVPLQTNDRLLNADEISRLVRLFSSKGVDKVRLTGGEPLLRKDLSTIISNIASDQSINSVGITTNAMTLSRHLPSLVESGLTHANISLDTLQASKFQEITRRKGLSQVLKAIENAAEALPKGNVKINCVVMKGFNDNELRDFIQLTKDLPVDMRFIEWMPFNDNGWNKDRFLSYKDMMHRITSDECDVASASMKGLSVYELSRLVDGPNDTTKWWQVPGHLGRIGFITSMTNHFCGTCNRMRVTADGQLKVCLFGSAEVSLRDAMREGASDEDLGAIIWAALQNKHYALGGHGNAEGIKKANNNRPMTLIGG